MPIPHKFPIDRIIYIGMLLRFIKRVVLVMLLVTAVSGNAYAQLDSAVREALDEKLEAYFAAIERAGTDVQKGECDFLIETCTDSLMRQHVALAVYDHYVSSEVMGAEAVAVHVFDK